MRLACYVLLVFSLAIFVWMAQTILELRGLREAVLVQDSEKVGLPASRLAQTTTSIAPEVQGSTQENRAATAGVSELEENLRRAIGQRNLERARSPEIMPILGQIARIDARLELRPICHSLGLNDSERSRIEQIFADDAMNRADLYAVAQEVGVSSGSPVFEEQNEANRSKKESELLSLLGPDRYRLFKSSELRLPERAFVGQVVAATYYTDEPLSPMQIDRLRDVIHAHTTNSINIPDTKLLRTDLESVLTASKGNLTPRQLEALRSMVAQVQLGQLMSN